MSYPLPFTFHKIKCSVLILLLLFPFYTLLAQTREKAKDAVKDTTTKRITPVRDVEHDIRNESNLNEVVVTGVSRSTVLRKSPVPIAVLSRASMDQQVNSNLIDAIVKGVPGVSAVTTGPNISKPFIRGLGYNRVLTLYDGLRQEGQQWGDEHGIEIDQYGIGRVEVVKGPASLTYGSDAVAGVINMIPYVPAFPQDGFKGDLTQDYQSNNGMFGTSLGLGYVKNDWKYLIRGTRKQAHSYRNHIDGIVYGTGFKEYNFSASAQVNKKWGHTKIAGNIYNNLQEIPDGSRDSLTRRFTKQILDGGDDIKNRPLVSDAELKSYQIIPLHQHIQHYRLYNTSQLKIGEGTIDVLLGGQQSVRREYNHPTLPVQPGLYVVLNSLNFDTKYNLPEFNGLEATVGVSGMYQQNKSKNATDFPIPDYNLFDIGGFLFAKKSFGKIDLSGGLRFDHRNVNWNDFYVGQNPVTGFGKRATGAETAMADLQFPAFNHNYKGISGSLGLTYNITERLLVKANLARGYRAPNITEIGSNGLDPGAHIVYLGNRNFVPEFNLQQDVGFIAYLKNLDISVELFNNNIQNYIYQARLADENGDPVVVVPGNLTYQYQQSKARLYGAEFSLNIHPDHLKWFSFNNSLAYVSGKTGEQYLPLLPPLHFRSEFKISIQQAKGKFSKPYFKLEADAYAAQNRFYALDDTETRTAGYTLINAGAGFTCNNKKQRRIFDLFIQGDNLFNLAYQSNLNRLKYFEYYNSSPNGKSGIYNIGRNFSFKMIVPM
ncbi:TonB-dependent receptor [Pedobacter sp. MC2016-24]|uniref:TonB-dependent receptor n=1 Tax=Pedobacter sp. MC2016-24 TaxID=2780090 RepID=UPI00187E5558|nr:TonB-dependent receptor [Pedobacter sp. MC2016-24]MBE9599098.1 TonB-dependent receptor [Pedobacter sp. MC2016-24]